MQYNVTFMWKNGTQFTPLEPHISSKRMQIARLAAPDAQVAAKVMQDRECSDFANQPDSALVMEFFEEDSSPRRFETITL